MASRNSDLQTRLLVTGNTDEAKTHLDAAIDLFRNFSTASYYAVRDAPETGDYAAGIKALGDPQLKMSEGKRAAILAGFRAATIGEAGTKAVAVRALSELSDRDMDSIVTRLLARLGANRKALQIVEAKAINEHFSAASWLWYSSMHGALHDPAAAGLVERIGLMKYWRASHTKPDVCAAQDQPTFCRTI